MTEAVATKTWFGQPRGLTILFLTEMWTEFSFFGMRALLVYYMTKELLFSQTKSSLIYGIYGAMVYFTPILGGAISDRWLGRKRAVIIGGATMAAGHFMMASPPLLYAALATIAIGNGLFLPSLPSQINLLYGPDDPRRASAYNIYYVGVNVGAVFAPIGCGTIGEIYGWSWGFALAGIGMLAGLLVYIFGQHYLPADPRNEPTKSPTEKMPAKVYVVLAIVALIVVIFRAAYEQSGNSVALWADTGVDKTVYGHVAIPMTWFQSLNPLGIFLFTPFMVAAWTRLAKRGREPDDVSKMAMGGYISAASYAMLAAVAWYSGNHPVSWIWLVAYFFVYTVGELFILPVGLGLFARLAPASLAATTIAAWFLASFGGNFAAGALGTLWGQISPASFFLLTAGVSAVSGVLLQAVAPWSRTMEKGRVQTPAPVAEAATLSLH
jgi:POT family proton-dependent oligopeptide transporter